MIEMFFNANCRLSIERKKFQQKNLLKSFYECSVEQAFKSSLNLS